MIKIRLLLFAVLHFLSMITVVVVSTRRRNELVKNQEHPDGTDYATMLATLEFRLCPLSLFSPSIFATLGTTIMIASVSAPSLLWRITTELAYGRARQYLRENW